MNKKLPIFLLLLGVLGGLSGGYVVEGLQAYSRYQQSSGANQEHCGGQSPVHICVQAPVTLFSAFYPSYVATHHVVFTISYNSSSPLTLVMSISILGLSQVEKQTVNANATTQEIGFTPPVSNQSLRSLTQEEATSLRVQVTDSQGHLYYVNDSPLLVHSRWLMQWSTANRLRIAAWVTPNDLAITQLVTQASSRIQADPALALKVLIGYNNNKATPQQIIGQVNAIYDALRLDHMQYVPANIPPYSDPGSSAATQNIKLPFEVLAQHSGMCIELTTLLASAVERIGLHAEIVIIPGHAFLGVATTADNKHFEYWDAVDINNNVAGASANIATDSVYAANARQQSIVDTILISEARTAHIEPMA